MRMHRGHRAPQHSDSGHQWPPLQGRAILKCPGLGSPLRSQKGPPAPSPQPGDSEGLSPEELELCLPRALPCQPSSSTETRSRLSTEGRALGSSTQPCRTPLARLELLPNASGATCLQVPISWEARNALPAAFPAQSPPRSPGSTDGSSATHPWQAQSPRGAAGRAGLQGAHRAWNLGCHRLAPSSSAAHLTPPLPNTAKPQFPSWTT